MVVPLLHEVLMQPLDLGALTNGKRSKLDEARAEIFMSGDCNRYHVALWPKLGYAINYDCGFQRTHGSLCLAKHGKHNGLKGPMVVKCSACGFLRCRPCHHYVMPAHMGRDMPGDPRGQPRG